MKRWLAGILGGTVLIVCFWQVARSHRVTEPEDVITLRFSHWQLEPGVRQAFDTLAREYEALHPGVRIEQIAVPTRIYRQWTSTQLIGGSPPDLVQIGQGIGGSRHLGYFRPITAEVSQPNPYNAGTALAATPWRNTFHDGMQAGFDPETFECYGASLFAVTIRFYVNRDLLLRTTGRTELPATFGELQTLCAEVRDHARRTGEEIEPIAGSSLTGHLLFDLLFRTQTQVLAASLNPVTQLPPAGVDEFYLAYLQGGWNLADPAPRAAAHLLHAASRLLTPGFPQIEHDQAHFRFAQGRAVLLAGFSLQVSSVLDAVDFPLETVRIPQPDPADPYYGPQMHGRGNDGGLGSYGAFGITRASRHPEHALDFLRFLTSARSCDTFTRVSRNLPTVIGVEPPEEMRGFMPHLDDFPLSGATLFTTHETRATMANLQHHLAGPDGSPERFLERLQRDLAPAMRRDLEQGQANRLRSAQRMDTAIAGASRLLAADPADATLALKYQSQVEAQNELEAQLSHLQLQLRRADAAASR